MASEKILNQKKEEVSKLAEEMKEAKIILLVDYRGINVSDVTNLRNDIRNVNAKYSVIKNNITRRALAECGIEGLEDKLVGPTAVIMSDEDYLGPAKAIYKFSKDNDYYKLIFWKRIDNDYIIWRYNTNPKDHLSFYCIRPCEFLWGIHSVYRLKLYNNKLFKDFIISIINSEDISISESSKNCNTTGLQ